MIRWVVFDVGCTLIDETRSWQAWAGVLGVPFGTFMGVLGGVIARGEHHTRAWEIIKPGIDIDVERKARAFEDWTVEDLYPDVTPCLRALRGEYRIGMVGNMPADVEAALLRIGLHPGWIGSSERWEVEKPAPEFFRRIVEECDSSAEEIVYVGDRLDNDILPALDAGMKAIHIRRGPWGYLHATLPDIARASARIESLAELPAVLGRL